MASETPRDVLESSRCIMWEKSNNKNSFLALFVKPNGLMKVFLFAACLRAKAFLPLFLFTKSFNGKKLLSSSCLFFLLLLLLYHSETLLAKKSNFILSVPERINTVKLHRMTAATYYFFLALFQTHNLGVNIQLKYQQLTFSSTLPLLLQPRAHVMYSLLTCFS